MAKGNELRPGDRVEWDYAQHTVQGKVKRRLTEPMDLKGHHVAASEEHPEYLVESDDGAEAAHLPAELRKIDG